VPRGRDGVFLLFIYAAYEASSAYTEASAMSQEFYDFTEDAGFGLRLPTWMSFFLSLVGIAGNASYYCL